MNYADDFPEILKELSVEAEQARNGKEASDILLETAKKYGFEIRNGVLFRYGEYFIQNIFTAYGSVYEKNLKILSQLNLDIIPVYIKTVVKDSDMFIFTKIKGCKTGGLIPYSKVKDEVSEQNKKSAFNDLKTLTDAGYVDNKIISSSDLWFVSSDDKKIILPSFESLRELKFGEAETVLNIYKRFIFD